MKTFNADQVRELELFANNEGSIYNRKCAIIKNLTRKVERKIYNPKLAQTLWAYWVDEAAKLYDKEFGSPGAKCFSVADRQEVARLVEMDNYQLIKDALSEVA